MQSNLFRRNRCAASRFDVMNALTIDAPRPTLATLPAEILHMIFADYRTPGVAQLYELRSVCRSVGAVAFAAFLAKIKNLLVVQRDRSQAFAMIVESIQSNRRGGVARLRPFSLGCLLRRADLPAHSPFIHVLLERLYGKSDSLRAANVGDFLRGFGCPADDALDTIWTLFGKFRRRPLKAWNLEQVSEALLLAFPDGHDLRVLSALASSPFDDAQKFDLTKWRCLQFWGPEDAMVKRMDVLLTAAQLRLADDEDGLVRVLASHDSLWKEPEGMIGYALGKTAVLSWDMRRRLVQQRMDMGKTTGIDCVLGLLQGVASPESDAQWNRIKPFFELFSAEYREELAATYFTRPGADWSWPIHRWHRCLDRIGYDFWAHFVTSKTLEGDEDAKNSFRAFAKRLELDAREAPVRDLSKILYLHVMGSHTASPGRYDLNKLSYRRLRLAMEVVNKPDQVLARCLVIDAAFARGGKDDGKRFGRVLDQRSFAAMDAFFGRDFGPGKLAEAVALAILWDKIDN